MQFTGTFNIAHCKPKDHASTRISKTIQILLFHRAF